MQLDTGSERAVQEVNRLNCLVAQARDQAEAKVLELNQQLQILRTNGLVHEVVLLGSIILDGATYEAGREIGAQIGRAALVGNGGIGVCIWELDEYVDARQSRALECDAIGHFIAFDHCNPWLKARLLPHLDLLIEGLLQTLHEQGLSAMNLADGF